MEWAGGEILKKLGITSGTTEQRLAYTEFLVASTLGEGLCLQ